MNDFQNQRPRQFSAVSSATEYSLNQLKTSFYFQDYTSLNKSLQISLGVRYEWQTNLGDYNNFSPRLGYVWSPEKSGKIIVRGGFGIFYDWLNTQTIASILSNDGRQGQKIIIINPGFPNPYAGGTVSAPLAPSISKIAENLQTPYILVTQNAVNYKINKTTNLEGIYTFRKGLHHFRSRDINAPIGGIRQNQTFGVIQFLESSGISVENSFELKANSYYKGVNLYANYKLSKNTSDFFSALSLPTDSYNLRLDRGVTNMDQTHRINLGINFDVWKNLNVAPTFFLESGFPYNITTGFDNNGNTVFNDRPLGIARNSERGEFTKQADLRLRWKLSQKYLGIKSEKDKLFNLNLNIRNLLNTANLTNYIGVQTSPFFRRATSAQNPRSIDLGISFSF